MMNHVGAYCNMPLLRNSTFLVRHSKFNLTESLFLVTFLLHLTDQLFAWAQKLCGKRCARTKYLTDEKAELFGAVGPLTDLLDLIG